MTEAGIDAQKDKVLIVDDNPANLRLLIKILTEQGYNVYPAAEGELALRFVESIRPDLILLDIMMPEMDGYEVCERLKANDRTRNIPIIFISAADQGLDKVKAFALGGVDYIVKPFQVEEVMARVKTHLTLHTMQKQLEAQNAQLQQEIIERQQIEEALEKQRTFLRQVIDINPNFIFAKDHAGYFTLVNQALADIFHATVDDLIGKTDADINPNVEEVAYFRHDDLQVMETLQEKLIPEERITDAAGQVRWLQTVKRPIIGEDGLAHHVLAVAIDITERKQVEEEIRQYKEHLEEQVVERTAKLIETNAQLQREITERRQAEAEREALIAELEAKNIELERFIYTISHDLKSPLITIRGFLGFIEQAAISGDIAQIKLDMARITNATDKMHQLLAELLELSRIGRLMSAPEAVPLGNLAREAVDMVAGRLAERGVEISIAPNLPLVYGDPSRLREVLENLVDNAVKYMGNQPQPRVEIGARYDGPEPVFYVRDNGMGIEPRYQQKVFGLFEKLDQETEGSGVGLAIIKRIVEVHGGRIWVESEGHGQGCTFCFTLADGQKLKKSVNEK